MRPVRVFKVGAILGAEAEFYSGSGIFQVGQFAGANDRRGQAGLVQQPSESDLSRFNLCARGQSDDAIDDIEIISAVKIMGDVVAFGSDGALV
jgi:hypothetical protein